MSTNTIRLHRVLRATPEKVYRAFLDADAMTKWLPPNGFTGKVHQMDAKVGGSYKMSFTNFSTGKSHSFGGTYRRTDTARTHSLHGQIRRSKLARRNADDDHVEKSFVRNGIEHRPGRRARCHPRRSVLSRLAGIADAIGETRRS